MGFNYDGFQVSRKKRAGRGAVLMFNNIFDLFAPVFSGLSPVATGFVIGLVFWLCGYCLAAIFRAFRVAAGCGGLESSE